MYHLGEALYRRRDEYPRLWSELRSWIGVRLRSVEKTDRSYYEEYFGWLLSDQMGVDDIHLHIYAFDLVDPRSKPVLEDMQDKLMHYANVAPGDVTLERMMTFYRTLPDRLEDDSKIYGMGALGEGAGGKSIGGGP